MSVAPHREPFTIDPQARPIRAASSTGILRELRVAARALRRRPASTLSILLTLALAVGVTTAILSAVEAILLHPIPNVSLDRIIAIESNNVGDRLPHLGLDPWEVAQLERRTDLFAAVAGYRLVNANLTSSASTSSVSIGSTTAQFFRVFGVRPLLGRLYETTDVRSGAVNVVVLGHDYWRSEMGGNPGVVGKQMRIDDSTFTIIGVLPAGFRFPVGAQLWTPKPLDPLVGPRAAGSAPRAGLLVPTIARLNVGVSPEVVRGALHGAAVEWRSEFPQFFTTVGNPELTTRSAVDLLGGQLQSIVAILLAAVWLLLTAACANIASLQLVRATGRAREMALRSALGASRATLLRYQALESLLLTATGGALGIALGYVLMTLARRTTAPQLAALQALRLDGLVLIAVLGIMFLAAVVFGTAPALRAMAIEPAEVLKSNAARTSSAGLRRGVFLRGAVVTQVALALVLLLCAGVALLSLWHILEVDPGFRAEGIVTARIELPPSRYPIRNADDLQRRLITHVQLLHEIESVPGIVSVATADAIPLSFANDVAAAMHRLAVSAAIDPGRDRTTVPANTWSVDESYFRTMGIPFRAGATFSNAALATQIRDYQTVPLSVVIDEPLAKRLFPGESPIGRIIGPRAPGLQVVGVVAPTRQSDLTKDVDAAGTIYVPNISLRNEETIIVRSRLPFTSTATHLRAAVKRFDPELALFDVIPLTEVVDRSVEARRLASQVLEIMGALALLLASLGVYGVLSYATAERVPEIGIRMAIGASPASIMAMVLRDGLTLVGIGVVIGLFAFIVLGRFLATLVFGISVYNLPTLAIGILTMVVVATAATLIPARRAARVDPVDTLGAS